MKFCEIRPFVRFADTVNYSIMRTPSFTYDSRMLYLLSGKVEFSLGENQTTLEEGALVCFPAGTIYSFRPSPSFTGVAIDFDFTEEYKHEVAIYPPMSSSVFLSNLCHCVPPLEDAEILNTPFVIEDAYTLREEFIEIASEFQRGQLFYRERCTALLHSLLCKLARRSGASERREETFHRVVGLIQSKAPNEVSNQNIATLLGYDASYLNRVMQFFTGLSLHQYVLKYRIDKAIALLLSTDMSVEEVALSCGFYSTAHFSNQCLKLTGHRPSFYKNKSQNI